MSMFHRYHVMMMVFYLFQHALNYLHFRLQKLRALFLIEPVVLQLLENLSSREFLLVLLHSLSPGVTEDIRAVHLNYLKPSSSMNQNNVLGLDVTPRSRMDGPGLLIKHHCITPIQPLEKKPQGISILVTYNGRHLHTNINNITGSHFNLPS